MHERRTTDRGGGSRVFWACAGFALAIHLTLLASPPAIRGGGDMLPHLRLIQQMAESPDLRNVYAPGFHVVSALLSGVVGLAAVPKLFGLIGVLTLLGGFRFFQRSARLPDVALRSSPSSRLGSRSRGVSPGSRRLASAWRSSGSVCSCGSAMWRRRHSWL